MDKLLRMVQTLGGALTKSLMLHKHLLLVFLMVKNVGLYLLFQMAYVLIGCDASGLELRCLAHYLGAFDEGSFTNELLDGDVHTNNQKQIGLPTRDLAKRVIYGCIYGIGDARLGSIVEKSSQEGRRIKTKLFETIPALKILRDNVIVKSRNQKYLYGLDKRKLIPRSEHSSLNLLIQSAGAFLIKKQL